MQLEGQNVALRDAQKQTRRTGIGAIVAVILLLAALGFFVNEIQLDTTGEAMAVPHAANEDGALFLVEPRQLLKVVTLPGQLAPRREVDVISPLSGKIASLNIAYGARVEQGDPLLKLDVSKLRIEHRDAEAAWIKARERFNETENWSTSVDVSRAQRGVSKARIALDDARSQLEETAFLLERGVIPTSRRDAAQRKFDNRRLDLNAAEQDLDAILEKGAASGRVARLDLENAKARLDELDETLRRSVLRALVAGVIMRPPAGEGAGSQEGQSRELAAGDSVAAGQRLLIIGDLEGVSVVGRIDELDVVRIRPGNPAQIKGDAFPGTVLRSVVTRVSSQAVTSSGSSPVPLFEVAATVDALTDAERAILRIGMSAALDIVVRDEPAALLVPLEAVAVLDGGPMVRRANGDGFEQVPVVLGEATVDAVEIVEGVAAGDRLLLSPR